MSLFLRSLIKLQGSFFQRHFEKITKESQRFQRNYLMKVLAKNRDTLLGKTYDFSSISSGKMYRERVPICQYGDLEPFVTKMTRGECNILTSEDVEMFNLTSGTTANPKYIPVTPSGKRDTKRLNHLWFYRALLDHPAFLNGSNLTITGSAIEGYTTGSIPFGSMSGLIYQNLASPIRKHLVLPSSVAGIQNYELRYYVMSRLAMGRDVSFIATPNPTTLIKLAEVGIAHQQEIIRSIHRGSLLNSVEFEITPHDKKVLDTIDATLEADPNRVTFLEKVLEKYGCLAPLHCWPSLRLIGCWLGGSAGYHAEKLSQHFGTTPRRDLGYLASEGCITLVVNDDTPAGVLGLANGYYEFIPEETSINSGYETLECHELVLGKRYRILLTNQNGLYRYDINDIVHVEGFYNQTPLLAFVRKTGDYLNITGEKVHVNQLLTTFGKTQANYNIEIKNFCVAANPDYPRYDILLSLATEISESQIHKILLCIDENLAKLNLEYLHKRRSNRLHLPCIHLMDTSWENAVKEAAILSGKRDIQFKWKYAADKVTDLDRRHITATVALKE